MRLGSTYRPGRVDLLIAGGLTALAQVEAFQYRLGLPAALVSLVITGALSLRSWAPLAVCVVVAGAMSGQALVLDPVPQLLGNGIATLVAAYSIMAAGPSAGAAVGGLGALVGSAVIFERAIGTPGAAVGDIIMCGGAAAVGWYAHRRRNAHAARLHQARVEVDQLAEQAERSLVEERRRIARELHDVVSHAITVVVLQARGGRAVLDAHPDQTRAALDAIEQSAQQALAEMRRLVILLREPADDYAPQPGLADLPALVGSLQAAHVELTSRGEPVPLSPGAELTAFRVVQEALTNALRHAPGQPVTVAVEYGPGRVVLAVRNPVPLAGTEGGAGTGHGLVGLRERVSLYGGTLVAGPQDGRWTVQVVLPVEAENAIPSVA